MCCWGVFINIGRGEGGKGKENFRFHVKEAIEGTGTSLSLGWQHLHYPVLGAS